MLCNKRYLVINVILAFGNKPEIISYDEGDLQHDLVECLKSEIFSPSPEYKNNKWVKEARAVTINQDVCCICRRTCFKEDTDDSPDNVMAPCCVCYE